jgi:hypothetical protein
MRCQRRASKGPGDEACDAPLARHAMLLIAIILGDSAWQKISHDRVRGEACLRAVTVLARANAKTGRGCEGIKRSLFAW